MSGLALTARSPLLGRTQVGLAPGRYGTLAEKWAGFLHLFPAALGQALHCLPVPTDSEKNPDCRVFWVIMDPCGQATHLGTRSLLISSTWRLLGKKTEESHTEKVTSVLALVLFLYDLQSHIPAPGLGFHLCNDGIDSRVFPTSKSLQFARRIKNREHFSYLQLKKKKKKHERNIHSPVFFSSAYLYMLPLFPLRK